ncbi:MAG: thioredoxin family protein [Patescibacteria group bacterium UBA2103]
MNTTNPKTYVIALVITVIIFVTAFFVGDRISGIRISQLQGIQDRIAIDILSLETQFDLLSQVSCETLKDSPLLSRELGSLGDRLQTTEIRLGADNEEVLQLKEQYSLLQIKDNLLLSRVSETCDTGITPVLYFYANDCEDCTRAGYALTKLRKDIPALRVYSFDYDLDLPALRTLTAIHNIQKEELPVFIIDGEKTNGFSTLDELTERLPEILTATSTEQ